MVWSADGASQVLAQLTRDVMLHRPEDVSGYINTWRPLQVTVDTDHENESVCSVGSREEQPPPPPLHSPKKKPRLSVRTSPHRASSSQFSPRSKKGSPRKLPRTGKLSPRHSPSKKKEEKGEEMNIFHQGTLEPKSDLRKLCVALSEIAKTSSLEVQTLLEDDTAVEEAGVSAPSLRKVLMEGNALSLDAFGEGVVSGRWAARHGGGVVDNTAEDVSQHLERWLLGRCKANSASAMAASLSVLLLVSQGLVRLADEQQEHIQFLSRLASHEGGSGAGSKQITVSARLDADDAHNTPILGMCNPLLDMTLSIDQGFLDSWGIEADSAALASDQHADLFTIMAKDPSVAYIPGGSGLNTMRVAQWILGVPGATKFIGTTGEDSFGSILRKTTVDEGVEMLELTVPDQATGTCAVLITPDNKRSLVANLGASSVFEADWLHSNQELQKAVSHSQFFYITGFFLRTAPETVLGLIRTAGREGKTVAVNLSAPFVVQVVGTKFLSAFESSTLIFGNAGEYIALSAAVGWGLTDAESIIKKIAALPGKKSKERVVVMTQGSDNLLVVSKGQSCSYKTPPINPADVVDTNGAGDGFVGGFLAQYHIGGSVDECVQVGQWAASVIIRRPGCTIPPLPPGCRISLSIKSRARPALSSHCSRVTKRTVRRSLARPKERITAPHLWVGKEDVKDNKLDAARTLKKKRSEKYLDVHSNA